MKIERELNLIRIYPIENNELHYITLKLPFKNNLGERKISIFNWSACGDVSIEFTEKYSEALLKAIEIAKQLNEEKINDELNLR